jgi:hypothetical protein
MSAAGPEYGYAIRLEGTTVFVAPDPFGGRTIAIDIDAREIGTQSFGSLELMGIRRRARTAIAKRTSLLSTIVQLDWGAEVARRATWVYLLFPSTFFLSGAYGESVLLAVAAGAILAARRRRWLVAPQADVGHSLPWPRLRKGPTASHEALADRVSARPAATRAVASTGCSLRQDRRQRRRRHRRERP